jgi:hypothetical protein
MAKMLYHGTRLTSMVRRAPQFGTGTSGLIIINNYVFHRPTALSGWRGKSSPDLL